MTRSRDYRPEIDGLRAIAVLAVIAYHANPTYAPFGFLGVDVFFVISGYLITGIILDQMATGSWSAREFYARRAIRLFPALAVVLLTMAPVAWAVLSRSEFRSFARDLLAGAMFVANLNAWRETGYFGPAAGARPLLHLWSLGVEEQFYVAWPAVIWLVTARGTMTRGSAMFRVTLGLIGLSLAASIGLTLLGSHGAAFYLPMSRFWELGFGCALATLSHEFDGTRRAAAKDRGWLARSGTLLIAACLFTPGPSDASLWRSASAVAGTTLLIAGGHDAWVNKKLLSWPALVGIGRISYPLYLWHWPVLWLARLGRGVEPNRATALAMIATFGLSLITYWFVESPIRFGARPLRVRVGVACAGLLLAGATGAVIGLDSWRARLDTPRWNVYDRAKSDRVDLPTEFGPGDLRVSTIESHTSDATILIGDSHMYHYVPRLLRVVHEHPDSARSAVLAVTFACPPFPDVETVRAPRECSSSFKAAIEEAMAPRVKVVVFGAYWEGYLLTPTLVSATDPRSNTMMIGDAQSEAMFIRFESEIARLKTAGKRVYIVLSSPSGEELDPGQVIAAARLQGADFTPPTREFVRSVFVARIAAVTKRLREAALRTGAIVIDPIPTLCPGVTCLIRTPAGEPLYRDGHHLRSFAARDLASFIDPVLLAR